MLRTAGKAPPYARQTQAFSTSFGLRGKVSSGGPRGQWAPKYCLQRLATFRLTKRVPFSRAGFRLVPRCSCLPEGVCDFSPDPHERPFRSRVPQLGQLHRAAPDAAPRVHVRNTSLLRSNSSSSRSNHLRSLVTAVKRWSKIARQVPRTVRNALEFRALLCRVSGGSRPRCSPLLVTVRFPYCPRYTQHLRPRPLRARLERQSV